MTDRDQCYANILKAAAGRKVEPLDAFDCRRTAGWQAYQCGDMGEIPKAVINRGTGNSVFLGYKAEAERLKVGFFGDGNAVYVGAFSKMSGDIQIKGNGITVFVGALTTISSINITQWGDGSTFVIGERCMISARIYSGNTDSHSIFDLESGLRINPDKDVRIGDHVWVARDVTIGKGARIGDNAVIGQGAYVTGEVEANAVYAGVPARKLRSGITWSRGDEPTMADMESSGRMRIEARQMQEVEQHLTLRLTAETPAVRETVDPTMQDALSIERI